MFTQKLHQKEGEVLSLSNLLRSLLLLLITAALLTACNTFGGEGHWFSPAQKPDIGPTGKPAESKSNPPILERFSAVPVQIYDLETIAGSTFEGINKEKWQQASAGFANLYTLWQQVKPLIGEKKGVKEADEIMGKLEKSINGKSVTEAFENLNAFMANISKIGKSYKLSPVSDIIAVGNAARNVSFFVEGKNWTKAASKIKELESTWNQSKPSMEQVGILGEMTKTHSTVNQLKDAIDAENQGAVEEQLANINESLGKIRMFFQGS